MESIRIGNVTIPKTAALAPMASVADRAYREICKEFGAAYVVGELASAKALTYSDRKTGELLVLSPKERPAAVQLFGSEPETMAEAAKIALQYSPDILDINMGLPRTQGGGDGRRIGPDENTGACRRDRPCGGKRQPGPGNSQDPPGLG